MVQYGEGTEIEKMLKKYFQFVFILWIPYKGEDNDLYDKNN